MNKNRMFGRVIVLTAAACVATGTFGIQPANASCTTDFQANIDGSGATNLPPLNGYVLDLDDYVDVNGLNVYGGATVDLAVALAHEAKTAALWEANNLVASSGGVVTATQTFAACVV